MRQLAVLPEDDEGEHDRREASRSEPADEGNRGRAKTGAEEGCGDRKHANDRQAQQRVGDDLPGDLVEQLDRGQPEREEDERADDRTLLVGETERGCALVAQA